MIHISKVDESNTVRLVVTRQLKELGLKLPRKLSLPLAMPLGVRSVMLCSRSKAFRGRSLVLCDCCVLFRCDTGCDHTYAFFCQAVVD